MLKVHKVHLLAGGCSGELRAKKKKASTTEYSALPTGAVHKVKWASNSSGLYMTTVKT